ncbi:MAG: hypothetical protein CFE33_16795 [Pseudorhodobacter sp. PARRP1]|nr:MAG: hypothetical protein CFE33_16795 [Pseudorhodobacter sp. PARRP1]
MWPDNTTRAAQQVPHYALREPRLRALWADQFALQSKGMHLGIFAQDAQKCVTSLANACK